MRGQTPVVYGNNLDMALITDPLNLSAFIEADTEIESENQEIQQAFKEGKQKYEQLATVKEQEATMKAVHRAKPPGI